MRSLGSNIAHFLANLNNLHLHLTMGFPSMVAPAFRVEQVGAGRVQDAVCRAWTAGIVKGGCLVVPWGCHALPWHRLLRLGQTGSRAQGVGVAPIRDRDARSSSDGTHGATDTAASCPLPH